MNSRIFQTTKLIIFLSLLVPGINAFAQTIENEEKDFIRTKAESPFQEQFFKIKHAGSLNITPSQSTKNELPNFQNSSNLGAIEHIGPYSIGARTRAILVDKNDSNLIFAGGTTGGLWKSINHGNTWNPINDQAQNMNVSCIAQNPFNPSIIYYGTGEYVGNHTGIGGAGIFKSTDGGNTFTQLPATNTGPFSYICVIRHALNVNNTFYVAADSGGLYKTKNGGTSFKKVYSSSARITDILCFADGSVWIAVSQKGIFKSPTGENGTFTKLTTGLPTANFSRIAIAYCDSSPQTVYAAYGNKLSGLNSGLLNVYKTTDGGTTWTTITNPDAQFKFYYPNFNLVIAVRPNNPNYVVCGAAQLTFSTDGGNTWNLAKEQHVDQHALAFDPHNLKNMYCGNDGGIVRYNTSNMGTTVTNLNKGYTITQFYAGAYFPTNISFLAGSQDNNSLLCFNGDSTFIKVKGSEVNGCYVAVNQQNTDISYYTNNYGTLYKSTNTLSAQRTYSVVLNNLDTNSNNQVDDDTWQINPFEMNMLDGNQLYFVTKKRIWRTVNGAQTWIPITNDVSTIGAPFSVGISNSTTPIIYIGGESGLFMRIDNAVNAVAGNEVDLTASLPTIVNQDFIGCIEVNPMDNSKIYVALSNSTNNPRIWKVSNATTSSPIWTNISGNLPANLAVTWVEADPQNPDSFLIAATDFGLYTTCDGGINWIKETAIPNVTIQNIRLRNTDRNLFIFTHGRGVYTAHLPTNASDTEYIRAASKRINILPNPNNGIFRIEADSLPDEKVTLLISDESNHIVVNKKIKPVYGKINLPVDLSQLSNGIYLITIQTSGENITEKWIKN